MRFIKFKHSNATRVSFFYLDTPPDKLDYLKRIGFLCWIKRRKGFQLEGSSL